MKLSNPGVKFDPSWIQDVHINLACIKHYTNALIKKRAVSGDNRAAWLLKAVTVIDLTTLAGDDSWVNVSRLCHKARHPIQPDVLKQLGVEESEITTAAVCVYPAMAKNAATALKLINSKHISVCAVAAGFPSGQYGDKSRLAEIKFAVDQGASEIDIVISRSKVLAEDWKGLYDEIVACKSAVGSAHMKTILAIGELGSVDNVYRASMVAMMAGTHFIKTSTGKEAVNATLPVGLVMCRAIRDYNRRTGYKVGLKPAGGIRTATDTINWLVLIKEELGREYLEKELFRIGASSVLGDIERELGTYVSGKFINPSSLPMS